MHKEALPRILFLRGLMGHERMQLVSRSTPKADRLCMNVYTASSSSLCKECDRLLQNLM